MTFEPHGQLDLVRAQPTLYLQTTQDYLHTPQTEISREAAMLLDFAVEDSGLGNALATVATCAQNRRIRLCRDTIRA